MNWIKTIRATMYPLMVTAIITAIVNFVWILSTDEMSPRRFRQSYEPAMDIIVIFTGAIIFVAELVNEYNEYLEEKKSEKK